MHLNIVWSVWHSIYVGNKLDFDEINKIFQNVKYTYFLFCIWISWLVTDNYINIDWISLFMKVLTVIHINHFQMKIFYPEIINSQQCMLISVNQ